MFPALAGNPTVLSTNRILLIRLILAGSALPSTRLAPWNLGMPAFGWRLSDGATAQLATFVRQSRGNSAPATTADPVATIRRLVGKETDPSRKMAAHPAPQAG